jgi:hypothetical protein
MADAAKRLTGAMLGGFTSIALIAGCASQPANQNTASSSGPIATTEAGRLALAKNLNLKLMNKDGQQLYCRSDYETGSHIQRDMTCYTADQLDRLQAQTQRDWNQITLRSTAGGAGKNPFSP